MTGLWARIEHLRGAIQWRIDNVTDPFLVLQRAGRIVVGRGTYGRPRVLGFEYDSTRLLIGNYSSIARNVTFVLGGNHAIQHVSMYPFRIRYRLPGAGMDGEPWSRGDIRVGSDVWLGYGATILSGVEIGDGAVVAAGSLVTRSVPPYAVVGGNPARFIRSRFEQADVSRLLTVRWWDWPHEEILRVVDLLSGSDLDGLEAYAQGRRGPGA